jgi:hypothetical protein
VKGTLIHRCVLAAGGKQFGPALEQRDDRLVWALIDSGGPYWTLAYDDYLSLKPEGQTRTVAGFEDVAVTTAKRDPRHGPRQPDRSTQRVRPRVARTTSSRSWPSVPGVRKLLYTTNSIVISSLS